MRSALTTRLLLGALSGVLLFLNPAFASIDDARDVRVRLETGLKSIRLNGMSWRVNGRAVAKSPLAMGRIEVRREKAGWELRVDGVPREMSGREIVLRGELVRSALKAYPGVVVLRSRGAVFDVLGEWPLSEYLAGVLAGEVPLSWPLETLKAQAIAARSYALASLRERDGEKHLEPTVADQVFRWPLPENDRRRALAAVRATDGMVLRESGGRVARAYYHADCGGRTVSAAQVWGVAETGTAVDETCPQRPRSRWELSVAKTDLAAKLRALLGPVHPDGLTLQIDARAGRAHTVAIVADNGKRWTLSGDRFRHLLGVGELKSTSFSMREEKGRWVFQGTGFGHGVGLCQWGSRDMGSRGESAERILAHYYPRFSLRLLE